MNTTPATLDAGSDPGATSMENGTGISPRVFWTVFCVAWPLYGTLFFTTEWISGNLSFEHALIAASMGVAGPLLPSIVVARRRDRLLPEGITPMRFIRNQAVTGIAFVLISATVCTTLFLSSPILPHMQFGLEPLPMFGAWCFNATLLYIMLLGFLTWSEAFTQLARSRNKAAQEAILRAEAEAQAVRAQFNPHFVFNTLHSLMVLVRAEPDRAEQAIEDVAELIRYASTLQRRQVDQVALVKELEFARRYLALEQMRLEDRLEVGWELEDGIGNALVPAFGLQTLLENAIKHGIAPKPEGGRVEVHARRSNGTLRLGVSDDGLGAPAGRVTANGGSGLKLLSKRLETTYDGNAELRWETSPGEGFRVTVELPVRFAEEG